MGNHILVIGDHLIQRGFGPVQALTSVYPIAILTLDAAEVSSFVSSVNGSSSCLTFWIFGIDIDVSW